jgi:phosphate transport system substrate-binding protein
MTQVNKCVSLLFLLALLTSTTILFAQDAEPINVVGSGIANSIVESLAEANETDAITITTTGTPTGFEQLCAGEADIATSTRAISADEDAHCISNDIVYSEFLVAHTIITFVAHPTVPLSCVTTSDLNDLFTPSATGQMVDWSGYSETADNLPITFILPQENTVEYVLLDSLVAGDGLRRDAETYTDINSAVSTVESTEGAIAVLPYNPAYNDADVTVLDVDYNTNTGCASPSAEAAENYTYAAAQPVLVYVNRDSLDNNDALNSLVAFATSGDAAEIVGDAGFVAPTEDALNQNAEVLTNADGGRMFSVQESSFEIPADLLGQIDIAGSANAYAVLNAAASQLNANNQQLIINVTTDGEAAGIRRLCNNEADITALQSTLADDALNACADNDINTIHVALGTQATVLVANAADSHLECLTSAQIDTIWNAGSTDTVADWSDIDASFDAQDMTLFSPTTPDQFSDILLSSGDGAISPVRVDTERNRDPLYRAAAVGNVEGALTYMSYTDYLRVEENEQQNIQLVAVDAGAGCTQPSESTIADGSYALARPASLLINEVSLTDISVQSYIWQLFSDQVWALMSNEGFVGINYSDLAEVRSNLEVQFSLAEAAVSEAASSD